MDDAQCACALTHAGVKGLVLLLLLLKLCKRALGYGASADATTRESFNLRLQRALNGLLWPQDADNAVLLALGVVLRTLSLPLAGTTACEAAVSQWLPYLLVQLHGAWQVAAQSVRAAGDMSQDVRFASAAPLAADSRVDEFTVTASVLYDWFRAFAPLAPVILGFRLFRLHEREVHVEGSNWRLPRGIYRSFLGILALEALLQLHFIPRARWQYLMSQPLVDVAFKHAWNLPWLLLLIIRVLHAAWHTCTLSFTAFLVTVITVLLTTFVLRAKALARFDVWRAIEHTVLTLCALVAMHQLAFVALARLLAIQAHQYAFALKQVAQAVLFEYRFARKPIRSMTRTGQLVGVNSTRSPPIQEASDAFLRTQSMQDLTSLARAKRTLASIEPSDESGLETPTLAEEPRMPRRRTDSIDVARTVALISQGVVPATPLERVEQFNLATRGERRFRKNATAVWSLLLAHASLTVLTDVYLGRLREVEYMTAATVSGNGGDAGADLVMSIFVGHLVHVLHLGYMFWFVQYKVVSAEQGEQRSASTVLL